MTKQVPFRKAITGLNVVDYGADPTGTADSRTAIVNTITAAGIAGKQVYVPAGRFKVSAYISLPSGITIKGAGPAVSAIFVPDDGTGDYPGIFQIVSKDSVTLRGLALEGSLDDDTATSLLVLVGSSTDVTINNCTFNHTLFGLKVDATGGGVNSGLRVTNCTMTAFTCMFLYELSDSYFGTLNLNGVAYTLPGDPGPAHHIYIDGHMDTVAFEHLTLTGGTDRSIQIYPGPSITGVTFTDIAFVNVNSGVVCYTTSGAITGVTFDGVTGNAPTYVEGAWFKVKAGVTDFLVKNFTLTGAWLVECEDCDEAPVFEDGTLNDPDDHTSTGYYTVSGPDPTLTSVVIVNHIFGHYAEDDDARVDQGIDEKQLIRVQATATGTMTKVNTTMSGYGAGAADQVFKGVVYADAAGEPGALLDEGTEFTVVTGSDKKARHSIVSVPITLNAYYHIGLIKGPTSEGASWYKKTGASGVSKKNTDTYAGGASDPFGAVTDSTSDYLCWATYS